MPKAEARYLTGTHIQFVSLVDKAANQRVFLTMKEQGFNHANTIELKKNKDFDTEDGPHLVTGIVYEPDVPDSQGDAMTAEEIEKAAHWYMRNARGNDIQHNGVQAEGIWLAECGITKADCTIDGQKVKRGTWYITVGVDNPEIRKAIRDEALTGFSMGGITGYVEKAAEQKEESGIMKWLRAIGKKVGIVSDGEENKEVSMTQAEKAEIIAEIKKAQEEESLIDQIKALIAQKKPATEPPAAPPKEEKKEGGGLTEERVRAIVQELLTASGKVDKSDGGATGTASEQVSDNYLYSLIMKAVQEGNAPLINVISKSVGSPQNLNGQTGSQGDVKKQGGLYGNLI